MRVGIISDTHGLLRSEVFDAFAGVEHILHAGDVGEPEILTELEAIAPVTAVWGNTDGWEIHELLPEVAHETLGGVEVVVLHGHQLDAADPASAAARHPEAGLVVFGHSHQPVIERIGSVWAVNPGSAGARRFHLPVTVAVAELAAGAVEVEIVKLLD